MLVKVYASCRSTHKISTSTIYTPGNEANSNTLHTGTVSCNWLITAPPGQIVRINDVRAKIDGTSDEVRFYDAHNSRDESNRLKRYSEDYESTSPAIQSTGSVMYITLWKEAADINHNIAIYLEFEAIGN